jgi:hypothetical protein
LPAATTFAAVASEADLAARAQRRFVFAVALVFAFARALRAGGSSSSSVFFIVLLLS